jgi:hypothetical protein
MAASSSSVNLNTEKEGKQQESDSEEGNIIYFIKA